MRRFLRVCFLATALAGAARAGEWDATFAKYGAANGETTVNAVCPPSDAPIPLTFGIPLGRVETPRHITLFDEGGKTVPADFTALGNWKTQQARWTLVSCTLPASPEAAMRNLRLRWGTLNTLERKPVLRWERDGGTFEVSNAHYRLTVAPEGIQALTVGGTDLGVREWGTVLRLASGKMLKAKKGAVKVLYDGHSRKVVRFVSKLPDTVDLHQECSFHGDSPFIRCDVRYVNRKAEDVPIAGVDMLRARFEETATIRVGLEEGRAIPVNEFSVEQEAFGWEARCDDVLTPGKQDNLGEWVSVRQDNGSGVMIIVPHFQEMAAGEDGVFSRMAFSDGALSVTHYLAREGAAYDVRFREGMARTFTYWLVALPENGVESMAARAVKAMPYAVYDREYLTRMGVFPEEGVSTLFDEELHDTAMYHKRAQVPRAEYIRCSRGTEPGRDKSGEGFYETNLHAGGMVFGETFQYFASEPTEATYKQYHDDIGIPKKHIVTAGQYTYRNGDIVLALFQQYLRGGDATLSTFAREHASVYADVGISHAVENPGLGHYYCDWFGNPYVYQRFEGLLLGYLVTGDVWWYETAQSMAEYCVRAWKDGAPRDGSIHGGYGGVQMRSPYVAKMLLHLHTITGDPRYFDTAVRLAEWVVPYQQPEGWWLSTLGSTREYRNTPIFSGYLMNGLWPLVHLTGNTMLSESFMRCVNYHVGMQEDEAGRNPGSFPNSYWYRKDSQSKEPPPEEIVVVANYAVTAHWANIMFEAFRHTAKPHYFYCANAAWVDVLNHRTVEGGVPLSSGGIGSVWGHALVEYLPAFAAEAEAQGFPIVMGMRTDAPVDCFMGKGAEWKDGRFSFGFKYRSDASLRLRVFFPAGKPAGIAFDGQGMPFDWDAARKVATIRVPPSEAYRVVRAAVFAK